MNREASSRGGKKTLALYGREHFAAIGSHHRRGRFEERQAARPRPRRDAVQPVEETPIRKSVFGPRAKRQQ